MLAFIYYPFYLISFWYKDVLGGLFDFFIDLNRYVASLLSLTLLLRTFFKPLKNEYRDGLVAFSIVFGMVIKSVLISISLCIVLILMLIEFLIGILMLILPIGLLLLIFYSNFRI
jgi:hypothetical protein